MGKKVLACCTDGHGKSIVDGGRDLDRNKNRINKQKGKKGGPQNIQSAITVVEGSEQLKDQNGIRQSETYDCTGNGKISLTSCNTVD